MTTHLSTYPIEVKTPEPVTLLESAVAALETGGALLHLTPKQGEALGGHIANQREYIDELEAANARLQKELTNLQHQVVGLSEIRTRQPFHMVAEVDY